MEVSSQITRAQSKFLDEIAALRATDPTEREIAYMARHLVQCNLPHSNPGSVRVWSRRNGNATLSIVPGIDPLTGESTGYPYGILPRLLLFWLVKEVTITKSKRLFLGPNFTQFMRQLGLNPSNGSGERSDARRLRHAMISLFRANISFEFAVTEGVTQGQGWLDMRVAPKGFLWWDKRKVSRASHGLSWIELSEDFYSSIANGPVPVHVASLRILKRSALALDLYTWLTYRVAFLKTPQFIPWSALALQFGSDYKNLKEFRRKVCVALRKVRVVYPELKLDLVYGAPGQKGGLRLHPSPTAVPRRLSSSVNAEGLREGDPPRRVRKNRLSAL